MIKKIFPLLMLLHAVFMPAWFYGQDQQPLIVKAGESRFGIPTPFFGVNPNDLKLSSKDTKGALSAFYYKGYQKIGPYLHLHLMQDEFFYVLGGNYIFQLGEEKQQLKAGDLIFLPRNIQHAWVQVSDTGEMFYFLQPAGKMEEFFLKMNELAGKGPASEIDKAREESGIRDTGLGLDPKGTHIFTDKLTNGYIIRAGETRSGKKILINGNNGVEAKVSGKDTRGMLSVLEYSAKAKGGSPMYQLTDQDETVYILEGTFSFRSGGLDYTLNKGDMIFFPKGVPHAWSQLTADGKLLWLFQPAGKTEEFFQAVSQSGNNDLTKLPATIYNEFGMKKLVRQ